MPNLSTKRVAGKMERKTYDVPTDPQPYAILTAELLACAHQLAITTTAVSITGLRFYWLLPLSEPKIWPICWKMGWLLMAKKTELPLVKAQDLQVIEYRGHLAVTIMEALLIRLSVCCVRSADKMSWIW